ncbi:hypothetical protein [Kangiella sp. TOML190]|uniref:hypothetical protein n=1 Tax=Kangiella sp. TOML190 TaxID=2931351 RepID=UPI00203A7123|nr:hypothetical protein [Kangiella sp. TOML190]
MPLYAVDTDGDGFDDLVDIDDDNDGILDTVECSAFVNSMTQTVDATVITDGTNFTYEGSTYATWAAYVAALTADGFTVSTNIISSPVDLGAPLFPLNNPSFEDTVDAQWATGLAQIPPRITVGFNQWHKFQGGNGQPDYTVDVDIPGLAGTGVRNMENIGEPSPFGGRAVWASSGAL